MIHCNFIQSGILKKEISVMSLFEMLLYLLFNIEHNGGLTTLHKIKGKII